jgi:dolichol-phosphate mannosyltransferase
MSSVPTLIMIPTYREAENIATLLEAVLRSQPEARILVMDDQSPDGTADVVRERFGHLGTVEAVCREGPRGYGLASRVGMARFLESGAERLVTLDADLSHDPAAIAELLPKLPPEGVVIGSRLVHGVRAMNWPIKRLLTTIYGNFYVRLVTRMPFADCTSGFRVYSREAIGKLDLSQIRARDYAFLVETLYWLWRAGCPIVEVPIVYRDRHLGESKLHARIFVESLFQPWRLRLRPHRSSPLHRLALPTRPAVP